MLYHSFFLIAEQKQKRLHFCQLKSVKSYSASGNRAPPSSFTETDDGRDKKSEDKGMKEILRLGDYGKKITDITKYLNTIWKKRKLNSNGQKHKAEKQHTENFETET